MDPLYLTLTHTTSRPATDHPINHTPRPSLPPMTKDPFLLQTIPPPPSPTKSRIADIFHRRRQASRQRQQQQPPQAYPHPPTSMPAALAPVDNVEMRTFPHDRAKKTDSTSTSMGTPKSPAYPPGAAAPLPVAAAAPPPAATTTTTSNHHRSVGGGAYRSAPGTGRGNNNKGGGLLLEGVRYSLPGGEPVGWYEMFEKTRKFEGGFVETKEGQVRCVHPCAWGEDELGEYTSGGGEQQQQQQQQDGGAVVGAAGGKGRGRNGSVDVVVVAGGASNVGNGASAGLSTQGGSINRADSETLGNGRFGESVVPTSSRAAALRSGLIGLDDGEEGDDEGEGGPSRGGSNAMEIKVILDEGPKPGMMVGGRVF